MCLTLQLPTLKSAKLSLLGRPLKVLFLLISLFFPCSPFVDVSFKRQTSALAADREASGHKELVTPEMINRFVSSKANLSDLYLPAICVTAYSAFLRYELADLLCCDISFCDAFVKIYVFKSNLNRCSLGWCPRSVDKIRLCFLSFSHALQIRPCR